MTKYHLSLIPETIQLEGSFMSQEVYINGRKLYVFPSLKVRCHSPAGFNWGYFGSGPAQLALAILLQYLPKQVACELYQSFKFRFIAGLPRTDFIKQVPLRQIVCEIVQGKTISE
jgi:hypothetical protein